VVPATAALLDAPNATSSAQRFAATKPSKLAQGSWPAVYADSNGRAAAIKAPPPPVKPPVEPSWRAPDDSTISSQEAKLQAVQLSSLRSLKGVKAAHPDALIYPAMVTAGACGTQDASIPIRRDPTTSSSQPAAEVQPFGISYVQVGRAAGAGARRQGEAAAAARGWARSRRRAWARRGQQERSAGALRLRQLLHGCGTNERALALGLLRAPPLRCRLCA
jgi:hypothetical protein